MKSRIIFWNLGLILVLMQLGCGSGGSGGSYSENDARLRFVNLTESAVISATISSPRKVDPESVPLGYPGVISYSGDNVYLFDTEPQSIGKNVEPHEYSELEVLSSSEYQTSDSELEGFLNILTESSTKDGILHEAKGFDYAVLYFDDSCFTFDRQDYQCIPNPNFEIIQTMRASANADSAALAVRYLGGYYGVENMSFELTPKEDGAGSGPLTAELSGQYKLFSMSYADATPGKYNLLFRKPADEVQDEQELSLEIDLKAGVVTDVVVATDSSGSLFAISLSSQ